VVRAAAALARRRPDEFAHSALAEAVGGDPERISAVAIAAAAATGDAFTATILHRGTRQLAAHLLRICADLGLRSVVVVGGFAHGVGAPWFAALRHNLARLMVRSGWYAGWTDADCEQLVSVPDDADTAPLAGMAAYLAELARWTVSAVKPVGAGRLVLRSSPRPRCGREQFLLRPTFAGICGTDLQMLRGERGCEPGVPGHECVAEVVEVGDGVPELRPGQVVGLNPNNPRDDDDKLGHNRPGVFGQLLAFDSSLVYRWCCWSRSPAWCARGR
jgi:hypothetical protein